MKIVFASHGSLGDLVPFLEIGKVLLGAGHTAVVATHAAHRGAVEAAGLDWAPMRPDRPDDAAFHARVMDPLRGPGFVYRRYLSPAIADSDADLMAASAGADVLVSVTLALAAPLVAARTGIAWRSAVFQPAMLYSAHDPPLLPLLPLRRGAVAFNRRMLKIARRGVEGWAAPLRAYRRAQGLGEYPDHPAFGGQHAPGGVLALYSPLFGPLPPDAPANAVQTGQVLVTGSAPLPADVAAFLDAGPPPVVFTLGSASAHAARRFFGDSARIARQLGVRALLLVGRPQNLAGLPSSPGLLAATVAPYDRVFPRCALAVHQGGIGTIALALASGCAMVAVPFAHDQPDNAVRAARLGAARVVPRRRYGPGAARLVADALADEAMAAAAARAGAAIRQECGAVRAAEAILSAAGGQLSPAPGHSRAAP